MVAMTAVASVAVVVVMRRSRPVSAAAPGTPPEQVALGGHGGTHGRSTLPQRGPADATDPRAEHGTTPQPEHGNRSLLNAGASSARATRGCCPASAMAAHPELRGTAQAAHLVDRVLPAVPIRQFSDEAPSN